MTWCIKTDGMKKPFYYLLFWYNLGSDLVSKGFKHLATLQSESRDV